MLDAACVAGDILMLFQTIYIISHRAAALRQLTMKPFLFFILAILPSITNADWKGGQWIWDEESTESSNEPRYFRRALDLESNPASASLAITADNFYEVWINGTRIGADGTWDSVENYDVVKYLKKGTNVLAIQARNGGGVAGVLAKMTIKDSAGKTIAIGTDYLTRASLDAPEDWKDAKFDDSKWGAVTVLGDASMSPWGIGGSVSKGSGSVAGADQTNAADRTISKHLPPQEEQERFKIAEGFEIELVAAEPLVINPVTMALDERDRLHISESHTYRFGPKGTPVKPYTNPIIRLDPKPGGGFDRVVVAQGFEDPVMGIAIRDGKLWAAANNYLFLFDLDENGIATNRRTLLTDKNMAWNPFGMFVLEWGPDEQLYMSVGNHNIDIHGPEDGKISGRGSSGLVMRMQPDGTKMERLVHGMRVPYSYEMDPFGQLWVLSNGQGNPDRFIRVIEGVDYHCYSRPNVPNGWLQGRHPLAPPCFELPAGARTQLLRYYGGAFPQEFHGGLFLDNWGKHGFSAGNRAIFHYTPDERNDISKKQPFLSCADPHFRCSHILIDSKGHMLVSDWYGRDDESDLTGRIWRVKPKKNHELATDQALKAANGLWGNWSKGEYARIATDGASHSDWRVRRLAIQLLKRAGASDATAVAAKLANDPDPAVRVAAAVAMGEKQMLLDALKFGAAEDVHLRYEAAWHLASVASADVFEALLSSDDANLRLAGMIAIDVACYESRDSKPAALAALSRSLADKAGGEDFTLLFDLARLNPDPAMTSALNRLAINPSVPAAVSGQALLLLGESGSIDPATLAASSTRFLEAVRTGKVGLRSTKDWLMFFDMIENREPDAYAQQQIVSRLFDRNGDIRARAQSLILKLGSKATNAAPSLWKRALNPKTKLEERLALLPILLAIEDTPDTEAWETLLLTADPSVRLATIRSWRIFADNEPLQSVLTKHRARLEADHPSHRAAISAVIDKSVNHDVEVLSASTLQRLAKLTKQGRQVRAQLGAHVFTRSGCAVCHVTTGPDKIVAPTLKGIGRAQKADYLIESVLFPSKILKTGFLSENVTLKKGDPLFGIVRELGDNLIVANLAGETTVAKSSVVKREAVKLSTMPPGLQAVMSAEEFVDLIAYLSSL
ncbi:MAG: putative membrane-bound dehydrogenase-like protein [Verrucomicrobiales bacterium]|jgi:putative membrane-bound dehydrogenase-like protein